MAKRSLLKDVKKHNARKHNGIAGTKKHDKDRTKSKSKAIK